MPAAKQDTVCKICGDSIRKGDEIRFDRSTVYTRATGSGRTGSREKWVPVHAHKCHIDKFRRDRLAEIEQECAWDLEAGDDPARVEKRRIRAVEAMEQRAAQL